MTPLPPLVDSHCHLTWDSFAGDLDGVLARMREHGVAQAVVVATDAATARAARELCRGRAGLFPTAGIHPNDLSEDWEHELAEIERLVDDGGFVAFGETGLDSYRDRVPADRQRAAFAAHCDAARARDLPVVVHIRDREGRFDAYDAVHEILAARPGLRGVIHCYTGDAAHAAAYRRLGFFISFSGIVTFPNGGNVRDVAAVTPIEETLVETDAPFLAPFPHRGKRNEPGFVAATARKVAELQGRTEEKVRAVTAANARRLFGLPAPG